MGFPIVNGLRGIEFGTKGEFREELVALILEGKKKATAGTLEWEYQSQNEPIEYVDKPTTLTSRCYQLADESNEIVRRSSHRFPQGHLPHQSVDQHG